MDFGAAGKYSIGFELSYLNELILGRRMKSHYRVVVIGGGVVGCSVLYHLTKLGWKDVLLIERKELTAGSTWHAAGGFHTINADTNMAALQEYTIKLYKELEQISGQACGLQDRKSTRLNSSHS